MFVFLRRQTAKYDRPVPGWAGGRHGPIREGSMCAGVLRRAYAQLELEAVAENERAIALYKSEGFEEYGRNPKGFLSRYSGFQELVYMRLDLQKIKKNN